MDKHKLAACGVDCNECAQYKVTLFADKESADLLVPWFRTQNRIGKDDNAEAVLKIAPLCKGCWSDFCFCTSDCLRPCCKENKIDNCGECVKFPCEKYTAWVGGLEHHVEAMERLTLIHKTKYK